MSTQTRQQRRADARKTAKQGPPAECMCGIPSPEMAADIKAYRHIALGITSDAEYHEVVDTYNALIEIRDRVEELQLRGITCLDPDALDEALDMVLYAFEGDGPEAATGYAALGDPAAVREANRRAENAALEADRIEYERLQSAEREEAPPWT